MASSTSSKTLRLESQRLRLGVIGGDDSPAARAVTSMIETGDYDETTLGGPRGSCQTAAAGGDCVVDRPMHNAPRQLHP